MTPAAFRSIGFAATALMTMAALSGGLVSAQAPVLPGEVDDKSFWQLIVELSEPDGYFEDENYVSNELGYQRSMRRLQEAIPPGGVFVGVGPEQNFSYVAALKPAMAFVIDIRRQNMIEHLMYKALFEVSADRIDFVGRLFSRVRPEGLTDQATADAIFQDYTAAPKDARLFEETLDRMVKVLTDRHQFPLSAADRAALTKVFTAFSESGPDIMYVFQGTTERHPTYSQMMTSRDERGEQWSYLATTARFEHVRMMQRKNLIVPVVGDFAGPKAVRAVGDYVRARGGTIDVFYASNVESYLFRAGTWKAFYDNLLTLPFGKSALVVRSFFAAAARECATARPTIRTPVIGAVQPLLTQYRNQELKTQCDLVTASR